MVTKKRGAMVDALQIIKDDHLEILHLFEGLEQMESIENIENRLRKTEFLVKRHFFIEKNFLFPEVEALCAEISSCVLELLDNQDVIIENLNDYLKSSKNTDNVATISELGTKLRANLEEHFSKESDRIMLQLRKRLSAMDREGLGEVLMDAKSEWENEIIVEGSSTRGFLGETAASMV